METEPSLPSDTSGANDAAAEQAAAWLAKRDRGLSPIEAAAFQQWLDSDPQHPIEYERINSVWAELAHAKAIAGIASMAERLDRESGNRRASRSRALFIGTMAAAASLAILAWWGFRQARPEAGAAASGHGALATSVPSGPREVRLDDGSILELRADAEIETHYTAEARNVRLLRGEANFIVAKNPARPFLVTIGPVVVRDVGTSFDVRYEPAAVEVLVTEGKVSVEDSAPLRKVAPPVPLLVAGQRATIFKDAGGLAGRVVVDSPDPDVVSHTLAGQSKWIVLDRTPLETAVAEFNRRSPQQIVLGAPSLRSRLMGGMFRADNVDGFVRMLEESADVTVERRGDKEIVLLPAR